MLSMGTKLISRSTATLFSVEFSLKGTTKKEFVYRYDIVDRLAYLGEQRANIICIREEEE